MTLGQITDGTSRDSIVSGAPRRLAGLGRLGDPLAWTTPEKCLFVSGVFLFLMAWYLLLFEVLASRPSIAPYLATR